MSGPCDLSLLWHCNPRIHQNALQSLWRPQSCLIRHYCGHTEPTTSTINKKDDARVERVKVHSNPSIQTCFGELCGKNTGQDSWKGVLPTKPEILHLSDTAQQDNSRQPNTFWDAAWAPSPVLPSQSNDMSRYHIIYIYVM